MSKLPNDSKLSLVEIGNYLKNIWRISTFRAKALRLEYKLYIDKSSIKTRKAIHETQKMRRITVYFHGY
jgi:hypothetical protein